jgi:hypothetical protein
MAKLVSGSWAALVSGAALVALASTSCVSAERSRGDGAETAVTPADDGGEHEYRIRTDRWDQFAGKIDRAVQVYRCTAGAPLCGVEGKPWRVVAFEEFSDRVEASVERRRGEPDRMTEAGRRAKADVDRLLNELYGVAGKAESKPLSGEDFRERFAPYGDELLRSLDVELATRQVVPTGIAHDGEACPGSLSYERGALVDIDVTCLDTSTERTRTCRAYGTERNGKRLLALSVVWENRETAGDTTTVRRADYDDQTIDFDPATTLDDVKGYMDLVCAGSYEGVPDEVVKVAAGG